MNNTTKTIILALASEPDRDFNYYKDVIEYQGKRYLVSLADETVTFLGNVEDNK